MYEFIEVQLWQQMDYDETTVRRFNQNPIVRKPKDLNLTHKLVKTVVSDISALFNDRDLVIEPQKREAERRACYHSMVALFDTSNRPMCAGDIYMIMCPRTCVGLELYVQTEDDIVRL